MFEISGCFIFEAKSSLEGGIVTSLLPDIFHLVISTCSSYFTLIIVVEMLIEIEIEIIKSLLGSFSLNMALRVFSF